MKQIILAVVAIGTMMVPAAAPTPAQAKFLKLGTARLKTMAAARFFATRSADAEFVAGRRFDGCERRNDRYLRCAFSLHMIYPDGVETTCTQPVGVYYASARSTKARVEYPGRSVCTPY